MKTPTFLFLSVLLTVAAPCVQAQAEKKPAAPAAQSAAKTVTPDEAEKLIKDKKAVVLDIRTADEFSTGHIPGAKNIDFNADGFEKEIAKLDKSQTYIVHCAAGGRSQRSMAVFQKNNFPNILHMKAGYSGWREAGKPMEK